MKKYILLITFLYTLPCFSQLCDHGQSLSDLNANNINATLRMGGDMFSDGLTNRFIVNAKSGGPKVASLSATSLWLSGFDQAGNLHVAAQTYRTTGLSYRPLGNNQSECNNWDRQWKVDKESILKHIADWEDNNIIDNKQDIIYSWPGIDNPYFKSLNNFELITKFPDLAPFNDINNDKIYNPDDGDYPALIDNKTGKIVIPAQLIWYIFNDNSLEFNNTYSNIYVTSWTFSNTLDPLLNNTIFTKHTLLYGSVEPLKVTKAGIWSDMELGCPDDDYVGCSKELSCFYVYNSDSIDGNNLTCAGINTFGDDPGVQAIVFLSDSLNSFIYDNDIQSTPPAKQSIEFYRLMNSMFKDGKHLKNENDGYTSGINTDYAFNGNPNNPNEWSMISSKMQPNNYRVIGTISIGTLLPGDIRSFTTAYSYFNNPELKSTGSDLDSMFTGVKRLHDLYDDFFDEFQVIASTSELISDNFKITPNPAKNTIKITYDNNQVFNATLLDLYSRTLNKIENITSSTDIDISSYPDGLYIIYITQEGKSLTKKLIIHK